MPPSISIQSSETVSFPATATQTTPQHDKPSQSSQSASTAKPIEMPPHDANSKDGNPSKLKVGRDFPVHVTKMKSQRLTRWVPFWRDTKCHCAACFTACADPSQHFKLSATCGFSSAVTCLLHSLEQNHFAGDFHPDPHIISIMLEDFRCPLGPLDILLQPSDWDPTQNFSIGSFENKAHVNQALNGTSFRALYETHLAQARIQPIAASLPPSPEWSFPDCVDNASQTANSVASFVFQRQRKCLASVEATVQKRAQEQVQQQLQHLQLQQQQGFNDAVQAEIERQVQQGILARVNHQEEEDTNRIRRTRPRTTSPRVPLALSDDSSENPQQSTGNLCHM